MFATYRRFAARIGRWPRRIAALVCLLLAAGSAVSTHSQATGPRAGEPRLGPGEVAVPVPVDATGGAQLVHPGDRVGVVAGPDPSGTGTAVLVADHLRVLSIDTSGSGLAGDASAVVVVAADRTAAVRLAGYSGRPTRVIVDGLA